MANTANTIRKVKDAKDLKANELIYFKGHAGATYMSDGTTVEDAINGIQDGIQTVIGHKVINHGTNDTTFTLTPNTLHVWDEVESLNISLGTPIQDVVNEYHFIFKTKAATTLSLPTNLKWSNNTPIVIESYKTYSISILNNLVIFAEFDSYIENAITYRCYDDGETVAFYSEYPLASTLYVTLETGRVYTLNSGESEWEFTYTMGGGLYASISFSNNGYIEGSVVISDSTYKYTIPETFIFSANQLG